MLSSEQQSMRRHLHIFWISQKLASERKIWSVVLRPGRKPHWPSSNFDSTISRHFFQRSWHTSFLEG